MDNHAFYVLKKVSTGINPTEYKEAEILVYDDFQNSYFLKFSIKDCCGVYQMIDWYREADVIMINIDQFWDGEEGQGHHCIFNDSEQSTPSKAICRNSYGHHLSTIEMELPTQPENENNELLPPKGFEGAYYV